MLPRKVCFFTCLDTRGVILKADNLRKQKALCTGWCFMCKEVGEDVEHLILQCDFTMRLWWSMFRCFGT